MNRTQSNCLYDPEHRVIGLRPAGSRRPEHAFLVRSSSRHRAAALSRLGHGLHQVLGDQSEHSAALACHPCEPNVLCVQLNSPATMVTGDRGRFPCSAGPFGALSRVPRPSLELYPPHWCKTLQRKTWVPGEEPELPVDDWFLSAAERGNPDTEIDRRHDGAGPGRPVTSFGP